jgi:hypothetical protein
MPHFFLPEGMHAPQGAVPVIVPVAPAKFSRANLRRVSLSALKAFGAASFAVLVARKSDLTSGHLTVTAAQSVGFAALIAGFSSAAKVAQVLLED